MVDYVYLDVFIEVRGRFWTFCQNFRTENRILYLCHDDCSGRLHMYYTFIHILYSTTPLVVIVVVFTVVGYTICEARPCIFGGLCEPLHDLLYNSRNNSSTARLGNAGWSECGPPAFMIIASPQPTIHKKCTYCTARISTATQTQIH